MTQLEKQPKAACNHARALPISAAFAEVRGVGLVFFPPRGGEPTPVDAEIFSAVSSIERVFTSSRFAWYRTPWIEWNRT